MKNEIVTMSGLGNEINAQLQSLRKAEYIQLRRGCTHQNVEDISDNPSAMGKVLEGQSRKRDIVQYSKNAMSAETILTVTHSAYKRMHKVNERCQEIVLSSNTPINGASIDAYAKEFDPLVEQLFQELNTSFSGNYLFSGNNVNQQPFVAQRDNNGKLIAVTYEGGDSPISQFYIGDNIKMAAYQDGVVNHSMADLMNSLINIRDALDNRDFDTVKSSISDLRKNETTIGQCLSSLGSKLATIQSVQSKNEQLFSAIDQSISTVVDADPVDISINLRRIQSTLELMTKFSSHALAFFSEGLIKNI